MSEPFEPPRPQEHPPDPGHTARVALVGMAGGAIVTIGLLTVGSFFTPVRFSLLAWGLLTVAGAAVGSTLARRIDRLFS